MSQRMSDKEARLFSFKKASVLSTKDYVIIFCITLLGVVFFTAVTYIRPLEYFHVVTVEQLQEIARKNLQGTPLENFKNMFLGQFFLSGTNMGELWRAAGWNSVWVFLCSLPETIFGVAWTLFPLASIFHFILNRQLKEMIQQLEKSPKQQRDSMTL
ncbi:hypothetical protein [Bartonella phoceensis]|uniref:hypothetical protein n=1 Tax=Bartonella phoceensis TaxID=270249 RepID=UPI001FE7BCB5|nr:hypothetical protein [Bartonella phoceensis]